MSSDNQLSLFDSEEAGSSSGIPILAEPAVPLSVLLQSSSETLQGLSTPLPVDGILDTTTVVTDIQPVTSNPSPSVPLSVDALLASVRRVVQAELSSARLGPPGIPSSRVMTSLPLPHSTVTAIPSVSGSNTSTSTLYSSLPPRMPSVSSSGKSQPDSSRYIHHLHSHLR